MIPIILILASTLLWQEEFTEDAYTLRQLYDYQVDIVHLDGSVKLMANPQFEGFASAWLYVDENITLTDNDVLEIRIRDNGNAVRIRYFFRKQEGAYYYAGENIVFIGDHWQDVEIPLKYAQSFSGCEFPAALTPGMTPVLYLFIENAVSGAFDVELDRISITRAEKEREEK